MALKTELFITISKEGQVTIEVEGVSGPSCQDISRTLEDALGRLTFRQKKQAFYETQLHTRSLAAREQP